MMGERPDILRRIADARSLRVREQGAAQGLSLPLLRELPLLNFLNPSATNRTLSPQEAVSSQDILIAEVKRRSPSQGDIAPIKSPQDLALRYREAGFRRLSVLTEEKEFSGSLADLIAVKSCCPDLAVLRKDFLLTLEDVEVSWRAGADALLLIAALLEENELKALYNRATERGLTCLVEVHSAGDVAKVRSFAPPLLGINSRDLHRFRIEKLLPLETRASIDWPCRVIYESGIREASDVRFVRGCGFDGFLAGQALSTAPHRAEEFLAAWADEGEAQRLYSPWKRLYTRYQEGLPLVKICGLTELGDAETAGLAGADLLGFVLAESPRRASVALIRSCADLPLPKVAVVALGAQEILDREIADLLAEGLLDFVQFHGEESPQIFQEWPGYKALRVALPDDLLDLDKAGSPAVLLDSFHPSLGGGTGKNIDPSLLEMVAKRRRLWLAGGLNPANIAAFVDRWAPGLVDVSSGVEAKVGRKDPQKIRNFIAAAKKKRLLDAGKGIEEKL